MANGVDIESKLNGISDIRFTTSIGTHNTREGGEGTHLMNPIEGLEVITLHLHQTLTTLHRLVGVLVALCTHTLHVDAPHDAYKIN
jgi:hypothetical protein